MSAGHTSNQTSPKTSSPHPKVICPEVPVIACPKFVFLEAFLRRCLQVVASSALTRTVRYIRAREIRRYRRI